MKNIWQGFIWYVANAFILVSVTSRYLLLNSDGKNNFVIYVFASIGFLLSFLYWILIVKDWKVRLIRWHLLFVIFIIFNQILVSVFLIFIQKSIFIKAFPVLFTFQLICLICTFISELHYREQSLKMD